MESNDFLNHFANVVVSQVNYKPSLCPELLYDEAIALFNSLRSKTGLNLDLSTTLPKGANVMRSENFQVFYNSQEVTIRNKFF